MSKQLTTWLQKAQTSSKALRILNIGLKRGIPFNKPHGIKVLSVNQGTVKTLIPYKKSNFNHIKGTHACGLATAAEMAAGMTLINTVDASKYRIIMGNLNITYHYQAKQDVTAICEISTDELNDKIIAPLEKEDAIHYICTSELYDTDNNHIATCKTDWQIKKWDKVKTRV